jgi:hypothetical protein
MSEPEAAAPQSHPGLLPIDDDPDSDWALSGPSAQVFTAIVRNINTHYAHVAKPLVNPAATEQLFFLHGNGTTFVALQ